MNPISVITIFGGDSWVNRGDEAILRGTLILLKKLKPLPSIQILTGNRTKTASQFPDCTAINRNNLLLVFKAFHNSDLILWGGGHLLQNASSRVFLIHQLLIIWIAIILKKKIISFCIGAEKISGNLWKHLVRITLDHMELITVRDNFTKDVIMELGINKSPILAADPALLIEPSRAPFISHNKKTYFIVSARRWFDYKSSWLPVSWQRSLRTAKKNVRSEDLLNTLAEGCDQIIEKHRLQVVFISMYPGHGQADEYEARYIINQMRHSESASIFDPNEDFNELQNLLSGAEFLIGMRMHATILSATANRPVIAIYYQNKGREFLYNIGQSKFTISVETLSKTFLVDSVDYIIEHYSEIRTDMSRFIDIQKDSFLSIQTLIENILDEKHHD